MIPELTRSPGGGNGKPLQYSCWENIPFAEKPGRLQSMGSQTAKRQLAHTPHCSVLEGGLQVFEGRAQKRKDLLIQRLKVFSRSERTRNINVEEIPEREIRR